VQSQDSGALGAPAQVKPDLNWVRLAQRIPVRVDLGKPSAEFPFRMGMSAVVTVRSAGNTNRP
jgi:multidrug resistance efflux pump